MTMFLKRCFGIHNRKHRSESHNVHRSTKQFALSHIEKLKRRVSKWSPFSSNNPSISVNESTQIVHETNQIDDDNLQVDIEDECNQNEIATTIGDDSVLDEESIGVNDDTMSRGSYIAVAGHARNNDDLNERNSDVPANRITTDGQVDELEAQLETLRSELEDTQLANSNLRECIRNEHEKSREIRREGENEVELLRKQLAEQREYSSFQLERQGLNFRCIIADGEDELNLLKKQTDKKMKWLQDYLEEQRCAISAANAKVHDMHSSILTLEDTIEALNKKHETDLDLLKQRYTAARIVGNGL